VEGKEELVKDVVRRSAGLEVGVEVDAFGFCVPYQKKLHK
jgi:hypothetical protein